MECKECGAALPGDETCQNRFHALLAAEQHNAELARMHGLTVLTYHLQHPSLTKAWYQAAGYDTMRRGFGQGRDWWEVLSEGRRRGTAEQDVARWKDAYKAAGTTMPPWVVTRPVAGELTVADVDPAAPGSQARRGVRLGPVGCGGTSASQRGAGRQGSDLSTNCPIFACVLIAGPVARRTMGQLAITFFVPLIRQFLFLERWI